MGPAGRHPIRLTIADVSERLDRSHLRVAYLSIIVRDEPAAGIEPVTPVGKPAPEPGRMYCFGVDCATVRVADAVAARHINELPYEQTSGWFDDAVFAERDYSTPESYAAPRNVPMFAATSGENYVMCPSGWGDGSYPVFATRTAHGELCAVHIDFEVVYDRTADYNAN